MRGSDIAPLEKLKDSEVSKGLAFVLESLALRRFPLCIASSMDRELKRPHSFE